eukprot:g31526.t1
MGLYARNTKVQASLGQLVCQALQVYQVNRETLAVPDPLALLGFQESMNLPTLVLQVFKDPTFTTLWEVTKRIDEGRAADVIHMDFSKAFNRFPMVYWLA